MKRFLLHGACSTGRYLEQRALVATQQFQRGLRHFGSAKLEKSGAEAKNRESEPQMRTPKQDAIVRELKRIEEERKFGRSVTSSVMTVADGFDEESKEGEAGDSLLHRRQKEAYFRQEAMLEEMRALKGFVTENANEPKKIAARIRKVFLAFDSGKTTAAHRCEALRRVIWLSEKYLSEAEWFKLVTHGFMIAAMEDAFGFMQKSDSGMLQSMSFEEVCDALWVLATLGYRPSKLLSSLVTKVDRVFDECRKVMAARSEQNAASGLKSANQSTERNREMFRDQFMGISRGDEENLRKEAAAKNMRLSFAGVYRLAFRNDSSDPTPFKLPLTANEMCDVSFAYGQLRVDSGFLVKLLYELVQEHFIRNNRLFDRFLPKDLANLCVGVAMWDPAFQFYEVGWALNRHLTLLGSHVPWTQSEKLKILHYDVCNRYVNSEWRLRISGDLQQAIDQNFVESLDRKLPPFYDPFLQSMYDRITDLVLSDQLFCKNVEGYQLPFSRWEAREEPAVIEPFSVTDFAQMDDANDGKFLLGRAQLRKNSLSALFGNFLPVYHWHWPQTKHLQHLYVYKLLKQLDIPNTVRLRYLSHGLDPHYKDVQKESH